nr:hypothetical protein [Tessaracoccus coleopterorum]
MVGTPSTPSARICSMNCSISSSRPGSPRRVRSIGAVSSVAISLKPHSS